MPTVPFLNRPLHPLNPSPYAGPVVPRAPPSNATSLDTARDLSTSPPEQYILHDHLHSLCKEKDPKLFRSRARGYVSHIRRLMGHFSKDSRFAAQISSLQGLFASLEHAIDMIKSDSRERRERYMKCIIDDARKASDHLTSMYRTSTATTRTLLQRNTTLVSLPKVPEYDFLAELSNKIIRTDLNTPRPGGPHSFRNSALYFPMDTFSANTQDVIMPKPQGLGAQYIIDKDGQIQSASYHALVYLLTSKQIVQDPELSDLFMRFFRTFAPPSSFLAALKWRYNYDTTDRPSDLTYEQRRVWENNLILIRIRVANRMLLWLTKYWTEEDEVVLHEIKHFVKSVLPKDSDMRKRLSDAIKVRMRDYRKILPALPGRRTVDVAPSTALSITSAPDTNFTSTEVDTQDAVDFLDPTTASPARRRDFPNLLKAFSSHPERREILANHITSILIHKFHSLNHLKVVELWHIARHRHYPGFNHTLGFGSSISDALRLVRTSAQHAHLEGTAEALQDIYDFASCLAASVSHSIIEPAEREERTKMIVFWINIASRCIDLRNYIASRAIIDGITHPAVTRMSRTVQHLPSFDVDVLFGLCRRLGSNVTSSSFPSFSFSSSSIPSPNPYRGEDYTQYRQELAEDSKIPTLPLLRVLNDDVYFATQGHTKMDRTRSLQERFSLHSYRVMRNAILVLEKSSPKYPLPPNVHRFADWLERKLKEQYHVQPSDRAKLQDWLLEESRKQESNPSEPQIPYVGRHGWVEPPKLSVEVVRLT